MVSTAASFEGTDGSEVTVERGARAIAYRTAAAKELPSYRGECLAVMQDMVDAELQAANLYAPPFSMLRL